MSLVEAVDVVGQVYMMNWRRPSVMMGRVSKHLPVSLCSSIVDAMDFLYEPEALLGASERRYQVNLPTLPVASKDVFVVSVDC